MGKTLKQVTNNPNRQECGKKSHQLYVKRLKDDILRDNQLSNSSSINNCTPPAASSTDN